MNESEWQLQQQAAAAEARGSPAGDAGIDRYRAVFRALAQAPRSAPPQDFAASVIVRVGEWEREERMERWILRVLGALAGIAIALYAGPMLLDALAPAGSSLSLGGTTGLLRSPLLWASLAAGATAGLIDRIAWKP